jgi:hypothetical protein
MHLRYKNFVYTPIPKVACTTIKREYIRLIEQKRKEKGKFPLSRIVDTNLVHKVFEKIRNFHVSEKTIRDENLFHFIFIRDPYDRLVSGYLSKINNSRKGDDSEYFETGVAKKVLEIEPRLRGGVTFPRFLDLLTRNKDLQENLHFYPQHKFLSDYAWSNVDFIGRMENFNEEWLRMCMVSGFPHRTLIKTNVSVSDKKYRDFYDVKTRKIAEMLYGEDIEKFKYKF